MTTSDQTIQETMRSFVAHIAQKNSDRTAIIYRQALDLFAAHLSKTTEIKSEIHPSSKITSEYLKSYLAFLQDNRSIETEHLYTRAVFAYYQFIRELGELDPEYAAISSYYEENRRAKEYTVPEIPMTAVEKVLTTARATHLPIGEDVSDRDRLILMRDKAYILVLSETGLRVSEMSGLKRQHFDGEQNRLIFEDGTVYPLSGVTASAVRAYLSLRGLTDGSQNLMMLSELPLFARHDKKAGKRILQVSRWTGANIVTFWAEKALSAAERMELEKNNQALSPHTFRHYFVLRQLASSENIEETQQLARHSDRATTRRYLSRSQELSDKTTEDK